MHIANDDASIRHVAIKRRRCMGHVAAYRMRCVAVPCGAARRRIHTGCIALYAALHRATPHVSASGANEPLLSVGRSRRHHFYNSFSGATRRDDSSGALSLGQFSSVAFRRGDYIIIDRKQPGDGEAGRPATAVSDRCTRFMTQFDFRRHRSGGGDARRLVRRKSAEKAGRSSAGDGPSVSRLM